jgi:23S rRNA pseudouridine1911/1915/1917 synthase
VLLVARDADTARCLSTAFFLGEVRKLYLAVVCGEVALDGGTIDLPVGRAPGGAVWVRQTAGVGLAARTDWEVARRLPGRTLLRVHPRTGRRHQIRVHLASIGHPVAGDPLYGRPDRDYLDLVRGAGDARRRDGGPVRQLLHCARLEFRDRDGARDVSSPLPADFGIDPTSVL